eukprot:SAG31_NODE_820_length_11808_cov_16.331540_8_plen_53_part_00
MDTPLESDITTVDENEGKMHRNKAVPSDPNSLECEPYSSACKVVVFHGRPQF